MTGTCAAQLSQLQLRGYLADARVAIRDTRFEDAGNALAAARDLGVSDTSEIDAVTEELSSARSQQRVDETLALANARLQEGDLLAPANDNARYYYDLVLSSDPTNTAARQGLNVIASKLVLQARSEIDSGNLDTAENLLTDARAIDAASAELTATEIALQTARDAIADREQRAAEARRQAEVERQAAAQRAEAERLEAERLEAERLEAERLEASSEAPGDASPAAQGLAASESDAAAGESLQDEKVGEPEAVAETNASTAAAAEPAVDPVTPVNEPPAETAEAGEQKPVPISSLTRTRYVAPRYPRAAQRRGESGWVDVVFTVALDGSVKNVEVRESQPEDVFDAAAIRAVEKWAFEPIIEDGRLVERRAGVRMMFAIE